MKRIEIGTPGYFAIGGDAYPVTLIKQSKTGKVIYVQYDEFVADKEAGHDYYGQQKWKFVRNENGRVERFDWSPTRQKYCQGGSGVVRFGNWAAKQDPSF